MHHNTKLLAQLKAIPNLLSLLRIILIPVFMWSYLNARSPEEFFISSLILIASGLTDMLDGMIARRFHMITDLGKILDPVADKLSQFAIIACLIVRYPVFTALLLVFIIKEVLMMIGGILLFKRKIHPGGAKWFGKLATCFFYVTTISVVLFPSIQTGTIHLIIFLNMVLLTFALIIDRKSVV